jgi:hypothetical protein
MKPFQFFLNDLLSRESGIDAKQYAWYQTHYQHRLIDYYEVIQPGILRRDVDTGQAIAKKYTIQEYFKVLGVDQLFRLDDAQCLKTMQYHSINCLGFVGYQFGEALLYDLGFYRPATKINHQGVLDVFYVGGLNDALWRAGTNQVLYYNPSLQKKMWVSPVNYWNGQFKGLAGLNSFADFQQAAIQDKIIVEAFLFNLRRLKQLFGLASGLDVLPILARSPRGSMLAQLFCKHGEGILSGILAAMHLAGPYGFYRLCTQNIIHHDEFSTPIFAYLEQFSGYDVEALYRQ